LVHGTNDGTVAFQHSEKFLSRLRAQGYQAELTVIEGGDHLDAGRWMFGQPPVQAIASFIE